MLGLPGRDMPYNNRFHNAITYEVSLVNHTYNRRVVNILDYLSEMGGLFNALKIIFYLVVAGLNYYGSYQYLMA